MSRPRSVDRCCVATMSPRQTVIFSTADSAEVACAPVTRHVDNAMFKAIVRAFRWRDMLESGQYATIREIASAEKINETYVGRVLRLALLAANIIEAILNGRQPAELTLPVLIRPFPVGWAEQRILARMDHCDAL